MGETDTSSPKTARLCRAPKAFRFMSGKFHSLSKPSEKSVVGTSLV